VGRVGAVGGSRNRRRRRESGASRASSRKPSRPLRTPLRCRRASLRGMASRWPIRALLVSARHPRLLAARRHSTRQPTWRPATTRFPNSAVVAACKSSPAWRSAARRWATPSATGCGVLSIGRRRSRPPASRCTSGGAPATASSPTGATSPGRLYQLLKLLGPRAPVTEYVGHWAHSHEFHAGTRLALALVELHLIRLRGAIPPPDHIDRTVDGTRDPDGNQVRQRRL
jgi:hypothetical protein